MPSSSAIILCSSWGKRGKRPKRRASLLLQRCMTISLFISDFVTPMWNTVDHIRWDLLLHLFLRILQFLLLPLRHQVIQPAQLSLGEDQIQQLSDENQSQDLERRWADVKFAGWMKQRTTCARAYTRTRVYTRTSVYTCRLPSLGRRWQRETSWWPRVEPSSWVGWWWRGAPSSAGRGEGRWSLADALPACNRASDGQRTVQIQMRIY